MPTLVSTGLLTIIDVNDGIDGAPGPALTISPTAQGFTFIDGVASPAQQFIGFQITRYNAPEDVRWYASNGATLLTDLSLLPIANYTLGTIGAGSGDVAYLSLDQLGNDKQVVVTAVVGTLSATQTVLRLDYSTASAGATRNVFQGAWSSAITYAVGDTVVSGGSGWSCVLANLNNTPPTYPGVSNTWWTLVAIKGDAGINGTNGKAYTVNITGGVRNVTFDAVGASPTPAQTAFAVALYENGTLVTPATYSWACGGHLSGTGTAATFTPTCAAAFVASNNDFVSLIVTYAGQTIPCISPIAVTKIGSTGSTLYTWVAYADSANGATNFTTGSGTGKSYIGISNNNLSATESLLYTDYTWSLIKGSNGTNGTNGTNGVRGPATLSYAIAGTAWSDTSAQAALTSIGFGAPIMMDVVTLYNSASAFSQTRYYSGSAWLTMGIYLNGNMLVTGTITTDKLVSNAATVSAEANEIQISVLATTGTQKVIITNQLNVLTITTTGAPVTVACTFNTSMSTYNPSVFSYGTSYNAWVYAVNMNNTGQYVIMRRSDASPAIVNAQFEGFYFQTNTITKIFRVSLPAGTYRFDTAVYVNLQRGSYEPPYFNVGDSLTTLTSMVVTENKV
jgi:hypothetical protein